MLRGREFYEARFGAFHFGIRGCRLPYDVDHQSLNRKIALPTGRIETLFKNKVPLPVAVEELYLTTVSRPPSLQEMEKALAWLKASPSPKEGAQDLLWVLLNSREFLFNH